MLFLAIAPWLLALPATLVAMAFGLSPDVAFALTIGVAATCTATAITQAEKLDGGVG